MKALLATILAAQVTLLGCSSTSTTTTLPGPACVNGERRECPCTQGAGGRQTCEDGAWSGCVCLVAGHDAGTDAGEDAPPTADACTAPAISGDPYGENCTLAGPCPTCADGSLYRCRAAGGNVQPARAASPGVLEAARECRRIGSRQDAGTLELEYCCPTFCVRAKSFDIGCSVGRPSAFVCPAGNNGQSSIGAPAAFCSFSHLADGLSHYCCGKL